jgi:hypothetical protein
MSRKPLLLPALLFALTPLSLAAFEVDYAALRAARPAAEGTAVQSLTLERDAYRFRFESGAFFFLPPFGERTVGAVFVGSGSWELTPAGETERKHLALLLHDPGLSTTSDQFETAVFLFTDSTAEEIRKGGKPAGPDPRAAEVFDRFLKRERKDFQTNFHLRVLEDLADAVEPKSGVFLAFPEGRKLSLVLAAVDPAGIERLGIVPNLGCEETALFLPDPDNGGFWYLSHLKAASTAAARWPPLARALSYTVDSEIEKNVRFKGTTTIRFETPAAVRVIPLHLMPKLRLQEASFAPAAGGEPAWQKAAFVQEKAEEDATAAVILPEASRPGAESLLKLTYSGKEVLFDAGDGNFSVGARESWYPNFGVFGEPANFELTYRVPKDFAIVSVGTPAGERIEGNTKISIWKTEKPIRVAGFNYGKFKKLERTDKDSGFEVKVYTNPGTPDIIQEINMALRSASRGGGIDAPVPSDLSSPFAAPPSYVGPSSVSVDTEQLADSALVDGVNSARVYTAYFGSLPSPRVAITQQSQWNFGQSWPSLIYLPYLAFLDRGTRHTLGLDATKDFVDEVGPHEFAHQWWGHLVGWASYRDQWLSEGFAEFSAALVLENTGGLKRASDFWEKTRRRILESPHGGGAPNFEAGPITLGWRLASRRTPEAYAAMVYSKGAYVLQMLRMTMHNPASPNPDAAFILLMRDFASSYAGKNPSTADFQKVVERHMVPSMNATKNGKMDWFFQQWVDGTEIPRYSSKFDLKDEGGGKFRVAGTVTQDSVSKDFCVIMPLYFDFGKGKVARFGLLPLMGNTSRSFDVEIKPPQKPKGVLINALHDVLARD